MITFDIYTLSAFINENKTFLTGGRISKIQQPSRREFILSIRNNGETRQLYINIQPQFYHICFINTEGIKKRVIEIPKQPPMFCMLLRKYLESSHIIKINQPNNERILEFYLESSNNIGDSIYLCLAIELMGKHSNIILYNADTNIIIGCAHNIGAEKSRKREIYGGIPYVYPPQQNTAKQFTSLLDEYEKNKQTSLNDFIDNYYSEFIYKNKYQELKNQYKSIINNKLKKVSKSLLLMENKLKTDRQNDKYRLYGDLLMANIYQLKDYTSKAAVYDYENDTNITIELDQNKTIKENANKFYKQYNKSKTAKEKLSILINENTIKKEYYEQLLYDTDTTETIEELKQIEAEITEKTEQKQINKKKITPEIYHIDMADGIRIYIGKNNKQNDYIISKLASDEDIWFHVHNNAGSHVLLKTQNLSDELILYCAKLAKEYSSVKNSSKIGVIYTKRKYLRKPPGANPGYVTYKNETEIILD